MPIEGLNEFNKKLNDFSRKAKELSQTKEIPLQKLLTPAFMKKYTKFQNIDEMFAASGFKVLSQNDFESIPEDKLNPFIQANTKFKNWNEMLSEAFNLWAAKKLGF